MAVRTVPGEVEGCAVSDEGRLVAERYRLVERIGRGGMGTVWRAADELLGRQVAIKQLHISPHLADDELATLYERTRREAQSAARIAHPNVVVVHDVVDDRGVPCIVMEYVPSTTLADVLKRKGRIEPEEAARIGRGMIAALRAAHAAGVLHRDVKPGNVLLGTGGSHGPGHHTDGDPGDHATSGGHRAVGHGPLGDGRVVLTDFGIAVASGTSTLTKTGELVGSIDYVAPERVKGGKPGPASDLWALGATLYQAVEGRPPFRKDTAFETAYAIAVDELPPLRHAGVLAPLVEALLDKDPDARPSAETVEWTLRAAAAEAETELMRSSLLPERDASRATPDAAAARTAPDAVAPAAPEATANLAPVTAPTRINDGVVAAGTAPPPEATPAATGNAASGTTPGTVPHAARDTPDPAHPHTPTPGGPHSDVGTVPTRLRADRQQTHSPQQPKQSQQPPHAQQSQQSSRSPQSHQPHQPNQSHQTHQPQQPARSIQHAPSPQQPHPHAQSRSTPVGHASVGQASVAHPQAGHASAGRSSSLTAPTSIGVPDGTGGAGGRRRGRATLWGAVAVGVIAAGAGAVVVYLASSDKDDGGARPSARQSASQLPGSDGAGPAKPGAPKPKPSPVPAGYHLVHEKDLGVSFPVPDGWTRKSGTGEQVDYVDPTGKVGIKINVLDFASSDHLEHFEDIEAQWREREPTLKRLRMQRTTFRGDPAAIWEFSFRGKAREFRGIDLGFGEVGKEEYAIYVSGPSDQWSEYRPIFDVIKDSFHTADDVKKAEGAAAGTGS
ncbi:serine/threonine-protein kinase [Streptomyces youssoufiensis]